MDIALIGYGKMGRTIEALGITRGHRFPVIFDPVSSGPVDPETLKGADLAVEFTTPGSAPGNIMMCIEAGIPVVSGTTGWNKRFGEVSEYCRDSGGALFYASNFSIGVNILYTLNRTLAGIMERFPGYRVSMKEVHHTRKLDAPSGTAISLAEQIVAGHSSVGEWRLKGEHRKQDEPAGSENVLYIEAIREGEVRGEHWVRYESEVDAVTLGHSAKSRDAFAAGALMAAEFLHGKTGIFGMEDLLKL